jgi:hypothetical protein
MISYGVLLVVIVAMVGHASWTGQGRFPTALMNRVSAVAYGVQAAVGIGTLFIFWVMSRLSSYLVYDPRQDALERKWGDVVSAEQAERVHGLYVTGVDETECRWMAGLYQQDEAQPTGNGRPHYSNPAGGHLYYNVRGKWVIGPRPLGKCNAYIRLAGEVPTGQRTWRYFNGEWDDKALTIAEVLPDGAGAGAEHRGTSC